MTNNILEMFSLANAPRGYAGAHQPTAEITTVSRFWATIQSDVSRLEALLDQASSYSNKIIVGININKDELNTVARVGTDRYCADVELLPIAPWGCVTHALNLIINSALLEKSDLDFVLCQTPEVSAKVSNIELLGRALSSKRKQILVAGFALDGHVGCYPLEARTVPWHTLALWNARMLTAAGFPAVADRLTSAGMAEAAAIAIHQSVYGASERIAMLICGARPHWNTNCMGERLERHVNKAERVHTTMSMFCSAYRLARVLVVIEDAVDQLGTGQTQLAGMTKTK